MQRIYRERKYACGEYIEVAIYPVYTQQRGRGKRKKQYVQYDFRDATDGMLFSIVRPTLEECREERDVWLMKKTQQMD